jgi:cellulose synthase (UDP-forming)
MIEWYGWEHRYWRIAVMLVVLVLFVFSMSVPMSLAVQSVYAATIFAISLFLRRYTGTLFTLVMVVFSVNQSSRYLYWRMTETLVLDNWVDGTFGIILLLAEIYAWMVLLLGYVQTIWPLKRKPEPMPEDTAC